MDPGQLCNVYRRYVFQDLNLDISSNRPAYSAFIDLYLAIYPTTVLMKLHMSLRKRLALCAALGLGAMYVLHSTNNCSS